MPTLSGPRNFPGLQIRTVGPLLRRGDTTRFAVMRNFLVTDEVTRYAVEHSSWRPDAVARQLQDDTMALGDPAGMQIGDDQGQLLTMLTRLIGARRAVEVGTFTGYSSMCIARGLPDDGWLLCCDVSVEWTSIAQDARPR